MITSLPLNVEVFSFIAVSSRIMGFLGGMPFIGNAQIPQKFKIFLSLGLAAILLPVLPADWQPKAFVGRISTFDMMVVFFSEALFGLVIAIIVTCFVEIFVFAGQVLGRNMGYMRARVLDPSRSEQTLVTGVLFTQMFFMLFFLTNAHHGAIRFLVWSFEQSGPGEFMLNESMRIQVLQLSGQIFSIGFRIALPSFVMSMLIQLSLAFMAKFGQEFNVMFLSFSVRLAVGWIVLIGGMPILVYLAKKLVVDMIDSLVTIAGVG